MWSEKFKTGFVHEAGSLIAGLDAMSEGRNLAAACGALACVFIRRQEIADIHFKFTEGALHFWYDLVVGFAGEVGDNGGFIVGAAPADRATVIGLVIDRDATFADPAGVVQLHVAVDLVTMLVFFQRLVFPVFSAHTRVAASAGVDALAFVVRLLSVLTFGQFIQIFP